MPALPPRVIVLSGDQFDDLNGFYRTFYDVIDWQEDWSPAYNLDAFNDVLHLCFHNKPALLIWENATKSRQDLGLESTKNFYQEKIAQGKPFNVRWAQQKLEQLNCLSGQTLFDIIVEIIRDHREIELILN